MKYYKILIVVIFASTILAGCGPSAADKAAAAKAEMEFRVTAEANAKVKLAAETEAKAKADQDAKVKADADAKIKADADAKAVADAAEKKKLADEAKAAEEAAMMARIEEKVRNPEWNITEVDALKNGNLALATSMIRKIKSIPDGEIISPAKVIKTPWDYYGKPISFTGTVAVVDDYPPGSDLGKVGLASEIVMECRDGTIVDYFNMVPSGDIKKGQAVTITAYPVGRTEVANTLGGKFTHLIVVTNRTK